MIKINKTRINNIEYNNRIVLKVVIDGVEVYKHPKHAKLIKYLS